MNSILNKVLDLLYDLEEKQKENKKSAKDENYAFYCYHLGKSDGLALAISEILKNQQELTDATS